MTTPLTKGTLSFATLFCVYASVQEGVVLQIQCLAGNPEQATPGKFLLVQFAMAQVTQIGDSISALISQVNNMITNTVRNLKG